ncbi:unnamed protein product [Rotaria socialis]|uniref:Uncharacterized protein n=1 Tax=Rotaria socialis TaxID=392032 RepID=A0A820NNN2_9BILA|nr:unnamed protein product [Rotaria socialis]CAF4391419.1 unnamed protein product [Rotaria socialis]CAF4517188.1 unnamed protein product [Rotaria socialis]
MRVATVFRVDRSTIKSDRVRQGWRSIMREFALNTSTHGIPGIARSQSKKNRMFWSLSFLVFSGITLYFVIQTIREYFQYSTQTSVNLVSEWPQNFPAFTICNVAQIRYDQFIEPFLNYTNTLNITNTTDTSSFSLLQSQYVKEFFRIKINQNESIIKFFFPLSAMLIKCVFNDRICSTSDFTYFLSSSHGLCYTFNAKLKNMTNVRKSDEYGGPGKLELSLYAHSHQYIPYAREDIGMIAMVHDNGQFPMIEFAGRALVTGFKHRMTFSKKSIFYLSAPYSTCNDEIPLIMQTMFDNYPNVEYSYSEDLCYDLCTEVYTYGICGCIDPKQWNARSIVLPRTKTIIVAPLCNLSDTCYSNASITLSSLSSLLTEYCPYCSQQCSITDFIVKASMWKAPAYWLTNDIKHFVENSEILLPNDWSTDWQRHIQTNYLSIELVHESILVENYTQIPAMGPINVLSDVGGQTGLWIGISFLSLVEVAEMFYRLIRYQYYKIKINLEQFSHCSTRHTFHFVEDIVASFPTLKQCLLNLHQLMHLALQATGKDDLVDGNQWKISISKLILLNLTLKVKF